MKRSQKYRAASRLAAHLKNQIAYKQYELSELRERYLKVLDVLRSEDQLELLVDGIRVATAVESLVAKYAALK